MKVYVVDQRWYEDRVIVGVYASVKAAMDANPGEWILRDVEDGPPVWVMGDDPKNGWLTIIEHEVQG